MTVGCGRRLAGLWLANIAFHRELLTSSVGVGSLAGLHVSTPQGDHHRTLLGVPVAAGPHAREPRPPAATLHRAAEAPAADRPGGPGVLVGKRRTPNVRSGSSSHPPSALRATTRREVPDRPAAPGRAGHGEPHGGDRPPSSVEVVKVYPSDSVYLATALAGGTRWVVSENTRHLTLLDGLRGAQDRRAGGFPGGAGRAGLIAPGANRIASRTCGSLPSVRLALASSIDSLRGPRAPRHRSRMALHRYRTARVQVRNIGVTGRGTVA
jgi:hypothetical protein